MAVDSAAKRASATFFLVPSYAKGVIPGSSIDQAARQDATWCYRGILGAVPPAIPKILVSILLDRYTAEILLDRYTMDILLDRYAADILADRDSAAILPDRYKTEVDD